MKLRKKDLDIINLVREGHSTEQIAEKLKIPKSTVYYHLGRMKRAGVIGGFKVSINYKDIEDNQSALILIALNGTNEKDISEFINNIKKETIVRDIYSVSGEWDFVLRLSGAKEQVSDFLSKKLQPMPIIKKTYSLFLLKHFEN
jgi:Lrp/AsnC family leucine-responsive transcriptional regulator